MGGRPSRQKDHRSGAGSGDQPVGVVAADGSLDRRPERSQIKVRNSRCRRRVPLLGPAAGLARNEGKHMSRLSLFNSPLLLGFEHFERALDRVNKISGDGYPPYNVEQLGDNELRITLAVAGFTMADLSITIEDSQLVIRGKQADDNERVYLHRGIAARQFQRSFVLAEGIEVRGAWLENGLLNVDLVRPTVEARVRTVPIGGPVTGDAGESSGPRPLRPRSVG
jgi:HSP20 family molecular chaperone IbpA